MLTQEDYKKIQQWLTNKSVKDTEFNESTMPFKGNEIITIVQDNQNKKVFLKDLVAQIFNLEVSDFINVSEKYDAYIIDLEEAIRLIPSRARKIGQVITFLNKENLWQIYQFKGALNQWNVLDQWKDLFASIIIDSILPDEEDLTKSLPDENGNSYLSLKDREYNPEDFSGLGKVILRKNIVEVEDPIYGKVKKNVLYQDMINKENTIYEIRYDFDLEEKSVVLPVNCILTFKGGKLSNGTISLTNGNLEIYNGNFYKIALYPTNSVIKIFNTIFDCNNEKDCPIWAIHTPIYVYNSKFINIGNSSQNNCSGILVYGDCSKSIIRDCYFENIIANKNATGVHFGIRDDKVSYNFLIENCEFHNINGITDDGDGIKVIYGSHGENYYANAIITNCKFYDCSKRAIKLQSRGIKVINIYIENKCTYSCIDFQMGNAYVENVVIKNIDSYRAISISKITGYNYINNVDCEYVLNEERFAGFISFESSIDDYDDNNSIIITNCNCNKITSKSYNNITIDFRKGKTPFNIKEIILKNLKGLKTGPYSPYCYVITGDNDIYCNFLKIENIKFDYTVFSVTEAERLQINNYNINQNTIEPLLDAKFGTLNFLTSGLYSSTPTTKVFIQNGKRTFINRDVNDINLVITNSVKNTAVLGDTIVTSNNQYTLINLPSEENPNGVWQALIN